MLDPNLNLNPRCWRFFLRCHPSCHVLCFFMPPPFHFPRPSSFSPVFVESVRKEISSLCHRSSDQRSTIHNKVQPYAALIVPQKINKSGRWWLASSSLRSVRIGLDWIGSAWIWVWVWTSARGVTSPQECWKRKRTFNFPFSGRYKICFCFLMFHNLLLARA